MAANDKNLESMMKTLDDAWNSQDWDTFEQRHADNVAVFWPGQAEPTRGMHNHRNESVEFFKWQSLWYIERFLRKALMVKPFILQTRNFI